MNRPDQAELSGRGHSKSADEMAATPVYPLSDFCRAHGESLFGLHFIIGAASLALLCLIPALLSKITKAAR
jgi:hypothetical protein